ncbi:uncharacterized protein [Marmota flaviventris]|uniref:uncharacterized protein n=1 Tax=Marmota flaviventris TaxID=93162 RepID=UPI003A8C8413
MVGNRCHKFILKLCLRPGPKSSSSRCSTEGLLSGSRDRGRKARHGGEDPRCTHQAVARGRRQVFAPTSPKTPPSPLPRESAPSCHRCRPRTQGAREPRRSLRASTYRAVRGRRAQGRGARPEPSNRLTRECRSQSATSSARRRVAVCAPPASASVGRPAARRTRAQAPPPPCLSTHWPATPPPKKPHLAMEAPPPRPASFDSPLKYLQSDSWRREDS